MTQRCAPTLATLARSLLIYDFATSPSGISDTFLAYLMFANKL